MNDHSKLPIVSVITPSFNQRSFIEETIQSVLTQSYPNVEHIVIDGGSTDNTIEVLRRYDGRITWISERDRGQSDAINKGFLRARGEIVSWLCADDTYERNTVQRVVEHFQQHPNTAMIYGDSAYIDRNGTVIGKYPSQDFDIDSLLPFCFIPQPTVFFRKTVLDQVGLLDPELQYAMDLDMWVRIALHYRIDFIPQVLSRYRLHEDSKTVSLSTAVEREGIRVRDRYLNDVKFKERLGSSYGRVSSSVFLKAAAFFFYEGDLWKTFSYLLKAFAKNPTNKEILGIPFYYAWRAIRKKRNRKLAVHSASGRIEHLVRNRPVS